MKSFYVLNEFGFADHIVQQDSERNLLVVALCPFGHRQGQPVTVNRWILALRRPFTFSFYDRVSVRIYDYEVRSKRRDICRKLVKSRSQPKRE